MLYQRILNKVEGEQYGLAHAIRINGVIDVWKNSKTIYCKPDNEYISYENEEEAIEYINDKLQKHDKQDNFKKLDSGRMSYKEFRNNMHNQ